MMMTSNTINVRKAMKDECRLKTGKRSYINFKLSKEAVQQEISYILAIIERHVQIAMENAHNNKRKTIKTEDIINANAVKI